MFYGIWITTAGLQALIVEFGSIAFHVAEEGLTWQMWLLSLILGVGSFPIQQIINLLYRACQLFTNNHRMKKRRSKYGHLATQKIRTQSENLHPHTAE
jgi:Ca2+ transporting ATPase